jgi:phosphatidylinositol alpha-mannosyltransferase
MGWIPGVSGDTDRVFATGGPPAVKPLRIAHFHSTLPEPGRKVGGVEVFVHRLANRLVDRGHLVTMVTFGTLPADARYALARLGPAWLAANRASRLALVPLVLNRLPQAGWDVLHLHGDDWFMALRRRPTVRTFYGSALLEARTATSRRRQVTQAIVYPLETLSSRLATLSFDIGSALPSGYRTHGSLMLAVGDAPVSPPARTAHPTVLFVGTWEGRKRGAFLAERFVAEVLPRHPTARLLMVSDRCEPRPGVTWIRFPSDDELSRLYGSAWLFCMPSTYEGFGLPYLEAMTHGLPVVATPNPGARLVLEDGAGVLAADADLGRTLVALLDDDGARARLEACGRTRALDFSWDRVVVEHESAYERAIAAFRDGQ